VTWILLTIAADYQYIFYCPQIKRLAIRVIDMYFIQKHSDKLSNYKNINASYGVLQHHF